MKQKKITTYFKEEMVNPIRDLKRVENGMAQEEP